MFDRGVADGSVLVAFGDAATGALDGAGDVAGCGEPTGVWSATATAPAIVKNDAMLTPASIHLVAAAG